ncbi:hypothetical protein GGI20_001607 [Coemansia sp. BCRC 34301]|nr:hypothetical protein GGI20_001607 [Coemansia sp. BCRC 34301]
MTDNNNNNNINDDRGGLETEQNFETLLQNANRDRASEDFEKSLRIMEKKRTALAAKWTKRLKGKTLIDAEPAPVFAPCEETVEEEEAGDDAQHNVPSTTGADIDGNSVVGSTGEEGVRDEEKNKDKDEDKNSNSDDEDKESVADNSSVSSSNKEESDGEESDFDGGHSNASYFTLASLPSNRRILYGKNAPMTMDYRPDRLNVVLDENKVCIDVFFV